MSERGGFVAQLQRVSRWLGAVVCLGGIGFVLARLSFPNLVALSAFPSVIGGLCIGLCGAALVSRRPDREGEGLQFSESFAVAALSLVLFMLMYYAGVQQSPNAPSTLLMPPTTTLVVSLVVPAILLIRFRSWGPLLGQALALSAGVVCLLAILGHAFAAPALTTLGADVPMAMVSALLLVLASASILLARTDRGLMRFYVTESPFSRLLRRLTIPLLLLPIVLGGLAVQGEALGLFSRELGLAVIALMLVALTVSLLWWQALKVERLTEEHKQSLAGMEQAEERFRLLVQSVIDYAIFWLDPDGRIVTWNKGAERIKGYTAEEIIGQQYEVFFTEEDRQAGLPQKLLQLAAEQGRASFDGVRVRQDGSHFYAHFVLTALRDETGALVGFAKVTQDTTQQKLVSDEQIKLDALLNTVIEPIMVIDGRGTMETFNRAAEQTFGYQAQEVLGKNVSMLMPSPDRERHDGYLERYLNTGERHVIGVGREVRAQRKDGSIFPAELAVTEMRLGRVRKFTGVVRDISARKAAEEAIRRSQQELDITLHGAAIALWRYQTDSRQFLDKDHFCEMLGYTKEDLGSDVRDWLALVHPDDQAMVRHALPQQLAQGRRIDTELRLKARDGQWRWMLTRAQIVTSDAQGAPEVVMGTCLDITDRKQAEERVLHMAQHDPLTGLPNRALTYEFGERLLTSMDRQGTEGAVLFIDLDRFKPINDTYGHETGDAVLREVARRLQECVRGEDLVGRLGGDEFLVLLANTRTVRDVNRVALCCLQSVGRIYRHGDLELQVSPSVGISLYPANGRDIHTLIKHADAAMYHAKESGRNNVQFFTAELNERAKHLLKLEHQLRQGVEHDEFHLVYQPIVDTTTRAIIGVEALLRWPSAGIGPDLFIPVAETCGMILPLGEWVLREACRQQKQWAKDGLSHLKMSVNVSPVQFRHQGFRGSVAQAVVESGIDPKDLQLEITENALLKSMDEAVDSLRALKELGLKVALDDFGKGYSSLSYLKNLPIDVVKVDKDFVLALEDDPVNLAITEAIITLGNSLGLHVVAEGIESEAAIEMLLALQCSHIQGYHVCRPLPAAEFEAWYRQHAVAEA